MRSRFAPRRSAAVITAALVLAVAPQATAQTDDELDQTLDSGMAVVRGERVLDAGHVDMGPKFVDGEWTFLVHDDVAKADANATSVWRYPDETVLHVLDEGQLTVPDDPAYEFLGAAPGAPVWVVPQTQDPDVVWLGWNTQDPEVMETIDRGITLSLTGAEGPGTVTVYLQSGSFGEPQVLFDSRVEEAQSAWVDVNTHTHANWVFTEPGVYLLELTAEADLIDGSTVSDTQVVRFAVGSSTAPAEALAASWGGSETAAEPAPENTDAAAPTATEESPSPLIPVLLSLIGLVAVALVAGIAVVVVRGGRAKRRALAGRTAAGTEDAS